MAAVRAKRELRPTTREMARFGPYVSLRDLTGLGDGSGICDANEIRSNGPNEANGSQRFSFGMSIAREPRRSSIMRLTDGRLDAARVMRVEAYASEFAADLLECLRGLIQFLLQLVEALDFGHGPPS